MPDADVDVTRNSHVDPIPGDTVRWGIFWKGEFAEQFGEVTDTDDRGNPFRTKQSAVDHEIRMIDRDFYKLPE